MRKTNFKSGLFLICSVLITVALVSSMLTVSVKATSPTISINPEKNIFYTSTTPIYSTFVVNVTLSDVEDLYTWQVMVTFDPTIIQCIDAYIAPGSIFDFDVDGGPDFGANYVIMGSSKKGAVPGTSGSGVLATITFNITKAPSTVGESLSCGITIKTTGSPKTFLQDSAGNFISFTSNNGYYQYIWPTPICPYVEVKPNIYNASAAYDAFVDIWIGNVSKEWYIVGFQFILRFNATLLEPVEVLPGDFMEQFVDDGESIFYTDQHDYIGNPALPPGYNAWIVSVMIIPNATDEGGEWIPPFPEGEGTLATLKFKAIYETTSPTEAWTDLSFTVLQAGPGKYIQNYAINQYQETIPFEQLINGSCVVESVFPEIVKVMQDPPADNVLENQPVKVSANVTDYETGVKDVTLIYTTDNWTTSNPVPMTFNATSGYWEAVIPGKPLNTYVQYKVEAYDWAGNYAVDDNAGSYYTYRVIPEFTTFAILLLLALATLSAAILTKNKRYLKPQN